MANVHEAWVWDPVSGTSEQIKQPVDFEGARWCPIRWTNQEGPTYSSPGCPPLEYALPNGMVIKREFRPYLYIA